MPAPTEPTPRAERTITEFQRATEQLAIYQNRRDHADYGTPLWADLPTEGRVAYLRDAELHVGALALLGWAPIRPHGALYLTDERDTLKMVRETLCEAQTALGIVDPWPDEEARIAEVIPHRERIERLIAEVDRQRPLGPDGKHGDLHTATCGCEDR